MVECVRWLMRFALTKWMCCFIILSQLINFQDVSSTSLEIKSQFSCKKKKVAECVWWLMRFALTKWICCFIILSQQINFQDVSSTSLKITSQFSCNSWKWRNMSNGWEGFHWLHEFAVKSLQVNLNVYKMCLQRHLKSRLNLAATADSGGMCPMVDEVCIDWMRLRTSPMLVSSSLKSSSSPLHFSFSFLFSSDRTWFFSIWNCFKIS
jgi:hypothetical protein